MTEPDAWGRVLPQGGRADERKAVASTELRAVWSVARALLLAAGGLLALPLALQLGYYGVNLIVVGIQACLAPAAIVCWIKAVTGKGGDRWTAAYVGAYLMCVLVLAPIGIALR